MPKGVYPHELRTEESKRKTSETLRLKWAEKRKGKTYEEIFGVEVANQMKEKMRLAKLDKKMPWNKGFKKENHPRWIEDRSKVKTSDRLFHDPLAKQWRKEVLLRDNYKCKIADVNCKGRLEAHHI